MINKIPTQVVEILNKLNDNNFEAYIVGGCVRDLLLERKPKDWDVTTNAKPEEILAIFGDEAFYTNEFFTVGVKTSPIEGDEKEKSVIEVTTYRIESTYNDKRHPDEVKFADNLEEDLKRRDFTINALALGLKEENYEIIDLFGGQEDLKRGIIKAVGSPEERFNEDALRMMRAIRFYCQLPEDWTIDEDTFKAIKLNAGNLKYISNERVKDELTKIILSEKPADGVEMLHETGLLALIIPELEVGVGISQNRHHVFSIYEHLVRSLRSCPSKKLEVRLAALFHDIAKPQTKKGEGEFATFYNHDHVGAKIVRKILTRLKFSNRVIEQVAMLVNNHMFYYNPDEVGASSVRKLIKNVGLENMKDLVDLRVADRLGSGVPKAKPYKLRHLEYMVDKVSQDATSVKMLAIGGNDLMDQLQIKPGPQIGAILDVLLAEVIEEPEKNERDYLLNRAKELESEKLDTLHEMAKIKIDERKWEEDQELKKKHWIK